MLDTATDGPCASSVKLTMPFQDPKFLKPDFSHGPVHEKAVDMAFVPVNANPLHFISTYITVILGRPIRMARIDIEPYAV
jgi:hypothetical protein